MMESNLVILNYNPNGLWWGSEGGKHADGKKGRLDLELPFAEKKFGKIDVLCIQESHLDKKDMEGIPRTLHGFEWLHDPAQDGDKFAGVSIGYMHWIPRPENLMEDIWKNISLYKQEYENIELLKGRLQMVGFKLQEKNILVANFYGYAEENRVEKKTAYKLIDTARQICIFLAEKWIEEHTMKAENVMVLLTGDFNAAPNSIRQRNWELGEKNYTKHKQETVNKNRAMDAIEENFVHAKDQYKSGGPQQPYTYE